MERTLILLVASALLVFVAPGVRGSSHLSFASDKQVNITRDGCEVSKLCVETPGDCDPASNGTCLFASAIASAPMAPDGSNLTMQLRGNSKGYVALGLTQDASQGTTMLFICAQNSSNNGLFFFRTMKRNNTNGDLTPSERRVREIRGMVKDDIISCEFEVPEANATSMRSSHATTFSLLLGMGPVTNGVVGAFNVTLNSGPLNLRNPASTITTTMAPGNMTTPGSGAEGVYPHAVLLTLSVLSLNVMLGA